MNPTYHWKGKWAVVTGASAGIGKALATELAAGGANLVLTARRVERLEQLAAALRAQHGIGVEVCRADLAKPQGPQEVFDFCRQKGVDILILINNAGFGRYGEFQVADLARLLGMVQVNCAAVVALTRLFLPAMVERRRGYVLIVASTAAFQAVPYITTYAATKGFDLLFAEGLAEEMRPYGVQVCALCPGSTESEFAEVAGQPERTVRLRETAEKVARTGLRALAAGKHSVISGLGNRLGMEIQRVLPRRLVTGMTAKMFRPKKEGG
jgi:uncharacterized protein